MIVAPFTTAKITSAEDVKAFFAGPAAAPGKSSEGDPYTADLTLTPAGLAALDADTVPDDAPDVPDTFTPNTPEKADWVIGKIADARAKAARIRENCELMAREAERDAEALEWRYGPTLQALLRAEIAGGKKKSLRLPNGVLGLRQKPAGVAVTDEAAAMEWARENLPAAVVQRLDKKALGDVLNATGEVLPFARFTEAEEVFYIK